MASKDQIMKIVFSLMSFTENELKAFDYETFLHGGILPAFELSSIAEIPMEKAIELFCTCSRREFDVPSLDLSAFDLLETIGRFLSVRLIREGSDWIEDAILYIETGHFLMQIESPNINLLHYARYIPNGEPVRVYLAFQGQAGEIWRDSHDGYKDIGVHYSFNSHEGNRHHSPHVHIDYQHKAHAGILIATGEKIKRHDEKGVIPGKILKEVKRRVLDNKRELYEAWNVQTDGDKVDIDHLLGVKKVVIPG